MIVVDSWALMAWLQDERPSADEVEEHLIRAESGSEELLLSAINAGEVYYLVARRQGRERADRFRRTLGAMPIRLVLPDEPQIWEASRLKSQSRLSFADGFAAALALRHGCPLLTGDPEMRAIPGLRLAWLNR